MARSSIKSIRLGGILVWAPIMVLVLCTVSCPARPDGIYKYVDRDGTVTYSSVKPRRGPFETVIPSCLTSYINCDLSGSDWSRVPLNYTAYRHQIVLAARRYDVDPALLRAVVHAESNFNTMAVSKAGAQGLMQLMPQIQRKFGVTNPYNVAQNLDAGAHLLKSLLMKYRNNVKFAVAAYSAGADAVERYSGIPPYPETRNYVRRVTQLYSRYQRRNF